MSDVQRLVEAAKAVLNSHGASTFDGTVRCAEALDELRAAVEAQPPAAEREDVSTAQMRDMATNINGEIRVRGYADSIQAVLRSAADQIDAQASRIAALTKALETIAACRGSDERSEMSFMLGVAQQALSGAAQ